MSYNKYLNYIKIINMNDNDDNDDNDDFDNFDDFNIIDVANKIYSEHNCIKGMSDWFYTKGLIVKRISLFDSTDMIDKFIIITYKNNSQLWTTWTRQCRGVILHLDTQTNLWRPIKYMLQRGAEVLSKFHYDTGISETENIVKSFEIKLHPIQQKIVKSLLTNSPIEGYLTTKIDGMMVCITLYYGNLKTLLEPILQNSNDKFGKTLMLLAKNNNVNFLPIISTHKTFNITEEKSQSYIITALLVSLGATHYNSLCVMTKDKEFTPLKALIKYAHILLEKLVIFDKFAKNSFKESPEFITLCFEAVCTNRTCAWNIKHQELAVNYPDTFMKVLSYSYELENVPHFLFSDIIYKMGFDEPLWWNISHATHINTILRNLSKYILGEITREEFLKRHIPNNNFSLKYLYIDPEGFILWTKNDKQLDYNKIKSCEYYECHKPRNIPLIRTIAKHTTVFPTANKIDSFFEFLETKLLAFCKDIQYILGLTHNCSVDMNILPDIPKNLSPYDYIKAGLSQKALLSLSTHDLATRCKMMFSVRSKIDPICSALFCYHFPELTDAKVNRIFSKIIIQLILTMIPWEDNLPKRIHDLIISDNEVFQQMYELLLTYITNLN